MRANLVKRDDTESDIFVKPEFREGYRRVRPLVLLYGFSGETAPGE